MKRVYLKCIFVVFLVNYITVIFALLWGCFQFINKQNLHPLGNSVLSVFPILSPVRIFIFDCIIFFTMLINRDIDKKFRKALYFVSSGIVLNLVSYVLFTIDGDIFNSKSLLQNSLIIGGPLLIFIASGFLIAGLSNIAMTNDLKQQSIKLKRSMFLYVLGPFGGIALVVLIATFNALFNRFISEYGAMFSANMKLIIVFFVLSIFAMMMCIYVLHSIYDLYKHMDKTEN